jgi:hypothetical protein
LCPSWVRMGIFPHAASGKLLLKRGFSTALHETTRQTLRSAPKQGLGRCSAAPLVLDTRRRSGLTWGGTPRKKTVIVREGPLSLRQRQGVGLRAVSCPSASAKAGYLCKATRADPVVRVLLYSSLRREQREAQIEISTAPNC